jgi:hypothetical protein
MLLTISITLLSLVILNFILLVVSCNKTTKRSSKEQTLMVVKKSKIISATKKSVSTQLAPTGS